MKLYVQDWERRPVGMLRFSRNIQSCIYMYGSDILTFGNGKGGLRCRFLLRICGGNKGDRN